MKGKCITISILLAHFLLVVFIPSANSQIFQLHKAVKRDGLQWVFSLLSKVREGLIALHVIYFFLVCVGRAFLLAAINFACAFYYNHVSPLG